MSIAGLLGLSGVAVGAAGTHAGGGDLARLASLFFLIHAGAILAIIPLSDRLGRWRWLALSGASCLAVGTALFSSDLTALAFGGSRAIRFLAPVGGTLLLLGWLIVVVAPLLPGNDAGLGVGGAK